MKGDLTIKILELAEKTFLRIEASERSNEVIPAMLVKA